MELWQYYSFVSHKIWKLWDHQDSKIISKHISLNCLLLFELSPSGKQHHACEFSPNPGIWCDGHKWRHSLHQPCLVSWRYNFLLIVNLIRNALSAVLNVVNARLQLTPHALFQISLLEARISSSYWRGSSRTCKSRCHRKTLLLIIKATRFINDRVRFVIPAAAAKNRI